MNYFKMLILIILYFLLSGCFGYYTVEHYEFGPTEKNYYKSKIQRDIKISPYIYTLTKQAEDIDRFVYKGPYTFNINISDYFNKNRILVDLENVIVKLYINEKILVDSNQETEIRVQKIGDLEEFNWALGRTLELNWDSVNSMNIFVSFEGVFLENESEHKVYYERKVTFKPIYRVEKTNSIIDGFKSI